MKAKPGEIDHKSSSRDTVYACPKCDAEFPTPAECRAHIRTCEEA